MKIILEAKDIPIGSSVTKRYDDLRRTLINEIKVVADGKTYTNAGQQDCLFLMTTQLGSLEAICPMTLLEWVVEGEEEYGQLQKMIEKELP